MARHRSEGSENGSGTLLRQKVVGKLGEGGEVYSDFVFIIVFDRIGEFDRTGLLWVRFAVSPF